MVTSPLPVALTTGAELADNDRHDDSSADRKERTSFESRDEAATTTPPDGATTTTPREDVATTTSRDPDDGSTSRDDASVRDDSRPTDNRDQTGTTR